VKIEERLSAGLAVEEFVERLPFFAVVPPLVGFRADVLGLEQSLSEPIRVSLSGSDRNLLL